jgi:hypothetical protein
MGTADEKYKSYADPTAEICNHLHLDWRHCFYFFERKIMYCPPRTGRRVVDRYDRS